ncbi:MAG: ArsC family transcriptional regulator [Clostridia bacterium]|nr:ArsC family transcriptional regulator [Clostridia bacterium]
MMNIQLYISKKNFDVQKAERYFKERRIKVQVMDLKKHKLGERELQVMAKGVGLTGLIDREDKKVIEHPAAHCSLDSALRDYIIECPWLLKSPIVRNGSKCTIGYQPDVWDAWAKEG